MSRPAEVLQIATPFVWLGMVLAISGLETPLKFRAPGITRALGLGIGRLVFRALNVTELLLLAFLTVTQVSRPIGAGRVVLVTGLWVVLLIQACGLRPRLDRRAQAIQDGGAPGRSMLHHLYVLLEALKVLLLAVVGTLLASSLLA